MPPAELDKDLVFIVSGGRTGTTYFGDLLSDKIADCFSVHEPDMLDTSLDPKLWSKIRTFGFDHMVTGRLLGRTGIRNLTRLRLSSARSDGALVDAVLRHRLDYYRARPEPLLVESYYQWYGLVPVIRRAFPEAKIAGIVRDPRDWVRSWMNFGGLRNRSDILGMFGQGRLDPKAVGDEIHAARWAQMNRFERICWDWAQINRTIRDDCTANDHCRVFRFEDLFARQGEASEMAAFLDFVRRHPRRDYELKPDALRLDSVVNASRKDRQADWTLWEPDQARALDAICGSLMRAFGYGTEPEWLERVGVGPVADVAREEPGFTASRIASV